MSDNDNMSERVQDLQYKLIDTQLTAITSALNTLSVDVKKVLDDHELRLREKTKNEAVTTQQLATIQLLIADQQKTLDCFMADTNKKFDSFDKIQDDRTKRELSLWQTVTLELAKYILLGTSTGGIIVGLIKLFGLTF